MRKDHKIIVGVTGASGAVYAKALFEKLATLKNQVEKIDVVFSDNAKKVWKYELDTDPEHQIYSRGPTIHLVESFPPPTLLILREYCFLSTR